MAGRLPCVKLACGGGGADVTAFWERAVVAYKQQVPCLSTRFAIRGACGSGGLQDIAVLGGVSAPALTPETEQNNTILKR